METPARKLEELRGRIDALDERLAELLEERIAIVEQVAALKKEHWPSLCHIRSGREGQMHRKIAERFKHSKFPAKVALFLWRQIIGASTHAESPLVIAATSEEQAELARDYFGLSARIQEVASLDAAFTAIRQQQCTILLAAPTDLPVIRAIAPKLKIFAALPLVTDSSPSTLALAEIEPEPSGDDISYYLREGRIETQDGFAPDAQWLGAHPRPITLE